MGIIPDIPKRRIRYFSKSGKLLDMRKFADRSLAWTEGLYIGDVKSKKRTKVFKGSKKPFPKLPFTK